MQVNRASVRGAVSGGRNRTQEVAVANGVVVCLACRFRLQVTEFVKESKCTDAGKLDGWAAKQRYGMGSCSVQTLAGHKVSSRQPLTGAGVLEGGVTPACAFVSAHSGGESVAADRTTESMSRWIEVAQAGGSHVLSAGDALHDAVARRASDVGAALSGVAEATVLAAGIVALWPSLQQVATPLAVVAASRDTCGVGALCRQVPRCTASGRVASGQEVECVGAGRVIGMGFGRTAALPVAWVLRAASGVGSVARIGRTRLPG